MSLAIKSELDVEDESIVTEETWKLALKEETPSCFDPDSTLIQDALNEIKAEEKEDEMMVTVPDVADNAEDPLAINHEGISNGAVTGDTKGKRKFNCQFCNREFDNLRNMKQHVRIHTGETPFKCPVCDRKFRYRTTLSRHKLTHPGETTSEICQDRLIDCCGLSECKELAIMCEELKCEVCKRRFRCLSQLKSHKRKHAGAKSFNCSVCNNKYSRSYGLALHLRTHTGEKPYSCQLCNKKFTNLSNMKKHIQTHTGEKPYSCQICLKRFASKTDLQRHLRMHRSQKSSSHQQDAI